LKKNLKSKFNKNSQKSLNKRKNKDKNKREEKDKNKEKKRKNKDQVQVLALRVRVLAHLLILPQSPKMREERDVKIKELIVKVIVEMTDGKAAEEKKKDQDQETEKVQKKEKIQNMDHHDMNQKIKTEGKRKEATIAAEVEIINVLVDDNDCITLN